MYRTKYEINPNDKAPQDDGWTGAEIEQCCDTAAGLEISLCEAAEFVVPVSISAKERIQAMRNEAAGRFISASNPGLYKPQTVRVAVPGQRKFLTMDTKGGQA